jgi:hypothetical protein
MKWIQALKAWNGKDGLVVEPHKDLWAVPRKGTKANAEVKEIQSGKTKEFKVSIGKRSMKVDLKKSAHKSKVQTEAERKAEMDKDTEMIAREIDRTMEGKPLPKATEASEIALRAFEELETARSRKKAVKRKLTKKPEETKLKPIPARLSYMDEEVPARVSKVESIIKPMNPTMLKKDLEYYSGWMRGALSGQLAIAKQRRKKDAIAYYTAELAKHNALPRHPFRDR